MIECFPDAAEVIHDTIDRHGSSLKVAVLAPLTDLAKAAERDEEHFCRIGGLYIQGQAIIEDGRLMPDPAAYNLAEDMEAATRIFALQDRIPFTFVGKHAAYQIPLTRAEFNTFAQTGNKVGGYLRTHALKGIACFAERSPEVFTRVFGVEPDQIDTLDELSKPYDALVAKAIADPRRLTAVRVGRHSLIGMSASESGIEAVDQPLVRADVVDTILIALTRTV